MDVVRLVRVAVLLAKEPVADAKIRVKQSARAAVL